MTGGGELQNTLQSGKGLCPGLLLNPLSTLQVSDQGLGLVWGAVWDAVSGEGGVKQEKRVGVQESLNHICQLPFQCPLLDILIPSWGRGH